MLNTCCEQPIPVGSRESRPNFFGQKGAAASVSGQGFPKAGKVSDPFYFFYFKLEKCLTPSIITHELLLL